MQSSDIYNALCASFNEDYQLRFQAEQYLFAHCTDPGFFPNLLNILDIADIPLAVKKADIIFMKNTLKTKYSNMNDIKEFLCLEDKQYLKQHILNIICNQTDLTLVELITPLIKLMIINDFPNEWPDLISQIHQNLNTNEFHRLYSILYVIKTFINCYIYGGNQESSMIQSIKQEYFEQILTLAEKLATNVLDEEGFFVINIILKIYLESINLNTYIHLDEIQFKRWIQVFINVINMEYPSESKYNLNDKDNYILTKCKKNTYKCIFKLQTRYFMNSHDVSNEMFTFWNTAGIPALLLSIANEIQGFISSHYYYSKCQSLILQFIICVSSKPILPYLSYFIEFIPLSLIISEKDRTLYQMSPRDYMIKQQSEYDYYNIEKAITDFINYLCREVDSFPTSFVSFITTQLQIIQNTSITEDSLYYKESLLHCISLINDCYNLKELLSFDSESFLYVYVHPELTSSNFLMRARALATYRCFLLDISNIDHRNSFISVVSNEINQDTGYDNSPNIILYIECSQCIDAMIMNDDWAEIFVNHLSSIINRYIYIISLSCLSSPLTSLNHLLSTFSESITPYVPDLLQNILTLFKDIEDSPIENTFENNEETSNYNEEGEVTERKNECLNILYNIYTIEYDNKQYNICKQIEYQLLPFIKSLLEEQYIDQFAYVCSLLSLLLYHTQNYNESYRPIYASLARCAYEYDVYYYKYLYYPLVYFLYHDPQYMLTFILLRTSSDSITNIDIFMYMYTKALETKEYIYIAITLNLFLSISINLLKFSPSYLSPLLSLSGSTVLKYQQIDPEDEDIQNLQETPSYFFNNTEGLKRHIILSCLSIYESCIYQLPEESLQYLINNNQYSVFMAILEDYVDLQVSIFHRELLALCLCKLVKISFCSSSNEFTVIQPKFSFLYNLFTEIVYKLYIDVEHDDINNDSDDWSDDWNDSMHTFEVNNDVDSLYNEYLSPITIPLLYNSTVLDPTNTNNNSIVENSINYLDIYKETTNELNRINLNQYQIFYQRSSAQIQEAITVLMNI